MACIQFATCSFAACVLPDGREVEVTGLMDLNFNESECKDGHCGFPENFATYPSDCPSETGTDTVTAWPKAGAIPTAERGRTRTVPAFHRA